MNFIRIKSFYSLIILFSLLVCGLTVAVLAPQGALAARQQQPDPAEKGYQEAKQRYNRFMASPEKWSKRRNWTALINEFDALARCYPRSKRADDALYLAAGLFFSLYNYSSRHSDLSHAARRFRMLWNHYARSRLADDALYYLGMIAQKQHDLVKARQYWQRILKDYPQSDMRVRAQAALRDLAKRAGRGERGRSQRLAPGETYSRKRPRVTKAGFRERKQPVKRDSFHYLSKQRVRGVARVIDLRHWSSPTYTRVVIDLDHETSFTKGILRDKQNRSKTRSIYINLKNAVIPEVSREVPINDGILQKVRVSQFDPRTVRAVIHVADIDHYKIFALNHPPRIVVDVIGAGYKNVRRRHLQGNAGKGSSGIGANNKPLSLVRQLGLGVGTIVLDAGHGGKDPGALSPFGGREKDIVLDIAQRLKKILIERYRYRVIMTRERDRFIPLEERTVIANTRKADLFISIHANASRNRKAHGVETYFLNLSTDREAMELAARENSTSTKNISQLQSILNDLMKNSKIKESSRLAACVQRCLVRKLQQCYGKINNLGVKQAPFYVLIGAQMPSILVETSFISNKMEAKRLAQPNYRQKIAEGLADGIQRYIAEMKRSGI